MHRRSSHKRIGSLLVAAVAATSVFVLADARAEMGCGDGVLATDIAGDDTYAGQSDTGLESPSGDLISVETSLRAPSPTTTTTQATTTTTAPKGNGKGGGKGGGKPPKGPAQGAPTSTDAATGVAAVSETVTFVTTVQDLEPTSAWNFDLHITLDLVTESGRVITVDAVRSTLGDTATIDGSAAEVTFDNTSNTITVTGPATAFESVRTLALQSAESRYDSGAVLSPLADQASGVCTLTLDPNYTPPLTGGISDLPVKSLIIDTGVNGKHQEFADEQIFGWWDFSGASPDQTPAPGETWQDRNANGSLRGDREDPYDPDGHGSSTTSMLAGVNAAASKTPSACPGCLVAVAKVLNENATGADGSEGTLDGSIEDAIRWGVDTLDVDVISVSIGAVAPLPRLIMEDTYEAISYAHDNGVMVLFANGNGWGNAGVPGQPGGFMNYGNSTDVLSVGADGLDSFLVTTDPEVVAVFSVNAAGPQGNDYQDISGTSFSTPFTAGVAARLIGEGRKCEQGDLGPDSIEQLIKYTAQDRLEVPPSFEGYGVVTIDTMNTALGVVCGGNPLPTPDALNDFYVTNVSGTQRTVSSQKLDGPSVGMTETPFTNVSAPLVLGSSVPTGPKDAEIFRIVLAPGETLTAVAEGTGGIPEVADFDMALFHASGPEYTTARMLASSGEAGAAHEELTWTNASLSQVTVSLVVYGWSIVGDQPFTLGAWVNGLDATARAMPVFDGYVLADNLILPVLGG